jgi:hypothetical protein
MSNEPVVSIFNAANIVGMVSAAMAAISALLSYLSYRKSSNEYEKNKKDTFITNINKCMDIVYIELSDFIQAYTGKKDTKEKKIVRDKIVYSLESIRVNLSGSMYTGSDVDDKFGDLSLKISDTTFEINFDKSMHDLSQIKGCITNIKNILMQ